MTAASTNDGARQASVRAATGTALDHDGDWHALFDQAGIPPGPFGGRMLAWINGQLGVAWLELNGAMAAYAASQGYAGWSAMGTFPLRANPGSSFLTEDGGAVRTEAGGVVLTEVQPIQTEDGGGVRTEDGGNVLMDG
jgi:hypothetical protein